MATKTEKYRPVKAATAILAIAAGASQAGAARVSGLSRPTVGALLARNPESYQACKNVLAAKSLTVAERAIHHADDVLTDSSALQSATIAGILIDKHLALTGNAPSLVTVNVNTVMSVLADLQAGAPSGELSTPTLEAVTSQDKPVSDQASSPKLKPTEAGSD